MTGSRRARRIVAGLAVAVAAAVAVLLTLTAARPGDPALPDHAPDPANGEVLYRAGGCISCHRTAVTAGVTGPPAGGAPFATPVGTFWPGNLTPDPATGLGGWTAAQFVDAMTRGVSPEGRHYFPAFPYPSYRHMRVTDLLDLWAYLRTLEPVHSSGHAADVPLPRLARRAVGLWNRLALGAAGFRSDPAQSKAWNRGAYLVNGPGHCGVCHTPRNVLMIPDPRRALAGGPHPDGSGAEVPSLRGLVARGRYSDAADLVLALQFGETLGYDKLSSGGMADVQMNLALLPAADLGAIAEYLLSLE